MPTTTNKQRLLNQLLASQGACPHAKCSEPPASEGRDARGLPVLEQFIYGLCREGGTAEQADRAFHCLRSRFFDWNEVRVSSQREVEEAFGDLPDRAVRAQRLISFLQEVFETTFSFDLEPLHKKGLKQAAKQLARYQAANDYVVGWVMQQSLGGHAIPLDLPMLRVLRRLGLTDGDQDDLEAVRGSLEHLIPKARGPIFSEVVSRLANDVCHEGEPTCAECPLCADCPTAQEASSHEGLVVGRAVRPKPR
jgi:endonuclease-3